MRIVLVKNASTKMDVSKVAEFENTRYGATPEVDFTGEQWCLPNGSKADGVYLILNPPYREVSIMRLYDRSITIISKSLPPQPSAFMKS